MAYEIIMHPGMSIKHQGAAKNVFSNNKKPEKNIQLSGATIGFSNDQGTRIFPRKLRGPYMYSEHRT